jgi:hypothetical protein
MLTLLNTSGLADTITLQDNSEVNGKTSYHDGTFVLEARYRSGTKTMKWNRADVRMVEINSREFNPGEPPKDISLFTDHETSTRNASEDEPNLSKRKSGTKTARKVNPDSVNHSVLDGDQFNPSTDDVVWLGTKVKVTGRLVSIKDSNITFEDKKAGKRFQASDAARILIAPN